MLSETGTQYTERTITHKLLQELRTKGDLFWKQLPLLEIDGLKLVQSGAILRYLARKHNMYGDDSTEAVYCDMIADGLADLRTNFVTFDNYTLRKTDPDEYARKVRDQLLPRYLGALEEQLKSKNKGEKSGFLLGSKISYADVSLIEVLELVQETFASELEKGYPFLSAFRERMLARSNIIDYYKSGRRNPPLDDAYIAHVKEVLRK